MPLQYEISTFMEILPNCLLVHTENQNILNHKVNFNVTCMLTRSDRRTELENADMRRQMLKINDSSHNLADLQMINPNLTAKCRVLV